MASLGVLAAYLEEGEEREGYHHGTPDERAIARHVAEQTFIREQRDMSWEGVSDADLENLPDYGRLY